MKRISVKGSPALVPTYTAMTDNYALGKTLDTFIQFIDFSDNTTKDRLEQIVYKLKTQVVGELAASVFRANTRRRTNTLNKEEPSMSLNIASSSSTSVNNPSSVSGGRRLRNKKITKKRRFT